MIYLWYKSRPSSYLRTSSLHQVAAHPVVSTPACLKTRCSTRRTLTKHQRDAGLFIVIEAVGPLGPNLLVQIVEEL